MSAQAMSAGTAETRSGSGRQPASAVGPADAPNPLYQEGYSMTDNTDRLASVSSASAEHGYVAYGPDGHWHWSAEFSAHESVEDQRPATLLEKRLFNAIRNTTESLSQYTIPEGMVAWGQSAPAPTDWDGGNCFNADGDWVIPLTDDRWLSGNIVAYTPASPEPVPATNQAGEVELAKRIGKVQVNMSMDVREIILHGSPNADVDAILREIAALTTQPATSQEGEACSFCSGRAATTVADDSDVFPACPTCAAAWVADPGFALAATPTPPTLSEDLREIERLVGEAKEFADCAQTDGFDPSDALDLIREFAALSHVQVKA